MDFAKIQKYVVERGDKCVIVENDEPVMVVMSFRDYENLSGLAHGTNGAPPAAARRDNALTLPSRQDEWQTADGPETEFIVEGVSEEKVSAFSSERAMATKVNTFIPEDPPPPLARPRLDEIRLEDLPL